MKRFLSLIMLTLLIGFSVNALNSDVNIDTVEIVNDTTVTVDSTEKADIVTDVQEPAKENKQHAVPVKVGKGFSLMSLLRGLLGMITLFAIAYLFSSNRKAINWGVVGKGSTYYP